jgi:uncharacterized protein (TIGR02145 family)
MTKLNKNMKSKLFRKHVAALAMTMLLCWPATAQNGVTVEGVIVDSGTITLTMNWQNTGMPDVWSDTVWVFADYNKAGVMTRVPLSPGATLTATSAPGVGQVMGAPGNDRGVWVVGNARSAGSFSATVQLLTAATDLQGLCAYASNYPPVGRYVSTGKLSFTGTPKYTIVLKHTASGATSTVVSGSAFMLPADHTVVSFHDATGAPGTIHPGVNQSQGGCTFTQPPLAGTFANFPSTYSASTFVTLTDERDNNNYTVVKIGERWIMAQNLNYQKGLTWQEQASQPSSYLGQDLALIGHFWCPGMNLWTTAARTVCDVWGALYSWETAMSLDGRGTWTEVAVYGTAAANSDDSKFNHGRTAHSGTGTDGRGICPPNWHVPTEFEWGVLLDAMEGGGTVHQNAASTAWYGTNAGKYAKSACTSTSDATDAEWSNPYDSNVGTDAYGFRVLPAGVRDPLNNNWFTGRSYQTAFWSSSAYSGSYAWSRYFSYTQADVFRYNGYHRSFGLPVRCIRD